MSTELTVNQRVLAAREAGNVRRCHVVPYHGDYTVGKHSYDALSLLLILNPEPSFNLVKAVLWHDGGERWVGDMPAPAKWYDRELGKAYERAEERASKLWQLHVSLTPDEDSWLRAVDRIELWLWCIEQQQLGNNHIHLFIEHLERWFNENEDQMPKACVEFVKNFEWERLPEVMGSFTYRDQR